MATYTQMRSRLATDTGRSDLTSSINEAINRAIEHYEKERFWFNETSGTFSTVAGTDAYTQGSGGVLSDILEVDVLTITRTSTDIYPLDKVTFQKLREYSTTGTTSNRSLPDMWAYYKNAFYFYPVPDAAYTITVYYQKSYADLSADADTNDFTTDAEDLIEARARWWLWTRLRNYPAASAAKAEELEALAALREKTYNLSSTGRIASCS